uniref:Aftiphilin clathrin-binding box domain-containing protein n=1 Tax=Anopheles culicifacies TaxID=139723 RepID=A0A182MUR9_9DIPT
MSSQIPPLVCHTPPPIDFDADDDDYGSDIPEDDVIGIDDRNGTDCPDDDFGDFATVLPGATNLDPISTEAVIDNETVELTSIPVTEGTKGIFPARLGSDSPPSLILPPNKYSEASVDETAGDGVEEEDDIDFQPFGSPSQPPEPPPEDSISLPSLHFEADVSKSEEDDNVPAQPNATSSTSSVSGIETEVDLPVAAAAERTTPVIQECGRFDDNTENDFTDFTTASNERSSVVLEIPTANDVSFELDDFAQLESTPSADSNFVSQQSRADFATFDADFSKFDSFQASFPATIDDAALVKTPVEETKSMPIIEHTYVKKLNDPQPPDDEFDDFQEFATFSEQPVATVSTHFVEKADATNKAECKPESTISAIENVKKDSELPLAGSGGMLAANDTSDVGDDDDDFGEFSDFKQPETVGTPAALPICTFSMDTVYKLLEAMFPTVVPELLSTDTGQQAAVVHNIPNSKLHSQLQDFDNTNALTYQHSKSSSSKTLVTALGIDSRNIMYGPKWNSSMPRFAANLSFNPLEPLKPIATSATKETGPNTNEKNANLPQATKATSTLPGELDPLQANLAPNSSVPAAQFDWNSSGLVNPLEGVQEMLQKAATGQSEDGTKSEILDSQVAENASSIVADDIAVKMSSFGAQPEEYEDFGSLDFTAGNNSAQYSVAPQSVQHEQQLEEQQESAPAHHHYASSHQQQPQPMSISSSPNSVPVVRTIKLPETHIFTPSRGVTPISRDITDRDIVVREYHDVEYSLERSSAPSISNKKESEFDEFNKFQSVSAMPPDTAVAISSFDSVRPVIGRSPTEEVEKRRQEVIEPTSSMPERIDNDVDDDDEFSDFQTAVPSISAVPPVNKPVSNVQNNRSNTSSPVMLLSPAILLPQQANTGKEKETPNVRKNASTGSINWPDPGIDPDELARFEAAFAKPPSASASVVGATNLANNQSVPKAPAAVEEDEWSDFISSKPATEMTSKSFTPNLHSAGAAHSGSEAAESHEEWTDFISSTAGTVGGYTSHNRLSSSQNNFNYPRGSPTAAGGSGTKASSTSWSNQPQLPPPQFSSWNSNSLYYNPMSSLPLTNQQHPSQYVPHQHQQQQAFYNRSDLPPMVFSGGAAGYGGSPKVPTNPQNHHAPMTGTGMTSMMMGQQQPMQLLPELSFITPNAGGHSGGPAGTKPTTHSFLSNVISSNSFTKK